MTTQPEQPTEQNPEEQAAPPVNGTAPEPAAPPAVKKDPDDVPITTAELVDTGKEIAARVRDGILKPVWRVGRLYIRAGQNAVDAALSGVADDKKDKD